jgi:hypothetical protein
VVATPSLTLTITPPGGSATDYSTKLAWSGASPPSIMQNFGRQGDTANFVLADDYGTAGAPTFHIQVLSQISFVDNTAGQTLFAGVVTGVVLDAVAPTLNNWQLSCTDYAFYADNIIVQGSFKGLTVDQIVIALTQQANCGISAASTALGGYVAPGPQLASFSLNYNTLSSAWRKLAQLAGQVTPYGWYVDQARQLHFYDATTAQASGVTFTTTPTTGGSLTEGHFKVGDGFKYEWDGASIRNRILVQGATQTIKAGTTATTPTNSWQSNGVQDSWPLKFTVTGSPTLHVNGVATTVTVVNTGGTATSTWQIAQDSVGGWTLTTTSVPPAGQVIQLWYDYQVPVVAQANDWTSQATYTGPNGGIFEEYVSDSSLATMPMALARAMRQRSEYAFAVERFTFSTSEDWLGWVRAGQTCTIVNRYLPDARNSYTPGINGTFIVIGNSIQFGTGQYRTSQITAIRL